MKKARNAVIQSVVEAASLAQFPLENELCDDRNYHQSLFYRGICFVRFARPNALDRQGEKMTELTIEQMDEIETRLNNFKGLNLDHLIIDLPELEMLIAAARRQQVIDELTAKLSQFQAAADNALAGEPQYLEALGKNFHSDYADLMERTRAWGREANIKLELVRAANIEHLNTITQQNAEIVNLKADLLEHQRMQSEHAAECERLRDALEDTLAALKDETDIDPFENVTHPTNLAVVKASKALAAKPAPEQGKETPNEI